MTHVTQMTQGLKSCVMCVTASLLDPGDCDFASAGGSRLARNHNAMRAQCWYKARKPLRQHLGKLNLSRRTNLGEQLPTGPSPLSLFCHQRLYALRKDIFIQDDIGRMLAILRKRCLECVEPAQTHKYPVLGIQLT
jgi:hypothetical protein